MNSFHAKIVTLVVGCRRDTLEMISDEAVKFNSTVFCKKPPRALKELFIL